MPGFFELLVIGTIAFMLIGVPIIVVVVVLLFVNRSASSRQRVDQKIPDDHLKPK